MMRSLTLFDWFMLSLIVIGVSIVASMTDAKKAKAEEDIQAEIPLEVKPAPVASTYTFLVSDFNGDGHPDLWCIKRSNTGSGYTEVHILDGYSNFKTFLLHTTTPLHETPEQK